MSEALKTTVAINGGPQVPIDLDKDINDPANAAAKEQLTGMFTDKGDATANQLRRFIERIERVEGEIRDLNDDRKDIYAEAKATGYDTRTIRELVKLRRLETHVRQERGALLATYANAVQLDLGL